MRIIDDGAMPHINEPTRNRPRETRYDHFMLKSMNMRPYRGWNADAVSRYDEPYHPMSSGELNSLVMKGIAWDLVSTLPASQWTVGFLRW